jgi:hypothetical protein
MREDLKWWDSFLSVFNGKRWYEPTRMWVNVYVDASLRGGGMVWNTDWAYIDWSVDSPQAADAHINVKEILAIGSAVRRWASRWSNSSVVIHTDNITAKAAINKGSARSKLAMGVVREVFWLSTLYNFKIRAVHIAGKLNIVADAVSRLHSVKAYSTLFSYLGVCFPLPLHICILYFLSHMTMLCFAFFHSSTGM